ncbi:MAG: hypothetical protein WD960_09210 [Gemmatimonadota bacterium]
MASVKVIYGWEIQDQAAAVPGLNMGPKHLTGSRRTGPLHTTDYHNLIGKNIVFHAAGNGALEGILKTMEGLSHTFVRSGIRPGMQIEKFEECEYGGGDDQVTVTATEKDIVRIDYFVYVFKPKANPYEFKNLLVTATGSMVNMISAGPHIASQINRTAMDAGVAVLDARSRHNAASPGGLKEASMGKEAVVVLTSHRRHTQQPIVTHKHTHRISTLAREVRNRLR